VQCSGSATAHLPSAITIKSFDSTNGSTGAPAPSRFTTGKLLASRTALSGFNNC
jgi:hypothetical protein